MKWWVLERPAPTPTEETGPFWEGVDRKELLLQHCPHCGMWQYPPAACCTRCLAEDTVWRKSSGRGSVFSFAVYHKAFHPAFADEVPYVVADIELDEGPIICSNVVGYPPGDVSVGMRVGVVFELVGERLMLPRFAPEPSGDEGAR